MAENNHCNKLNQRKVGEIKAPTEAAVKSKAAKEAAEDPNKPKRPGSAFFVFLEEFRETFKKENPTVKAVSVIGKASGEKWISMSAAEKAPYEAKAAERKADYEQLMTAYNKKRKVGEREAPAEAAGKSKAAKEAAEVPNKPKKPGSAFFVFLEEFREIFKKENPTVKAVSVEKAPYEAEAAKRKTDYEELMTAYNKKQDATEDDEESEKSKSEVDEESGQSLLIGKSKAAKKAAEDTNKPKRPPGSPFFVFLEEFREIFKKENPTVKAVSAVGKAGGEKWKSMSAAVSFVEDLI